MSEQMKSGDTENAISLPVSADGQLHLDLLAGLKEEQCGQVRAPVSHSVLPESRKLKKTSAIYGQYGSASSESVILQQSLESRLNQQFPTGGLTMFIRGWRQKATPLGRQYCQLAVLAHPTDETDFGLWETPNATDFRDRGNMSMPAIIRRMEKKKQIMLSMRVKGNGLENGFTVQMGGQGSYQLNPFFSLWLMGYSIDVGYSMQQAMRLYRK